PFGLGRIIRDQGKVVAIVEEKDADAQQKLITEINSGIYCVDNALLHKYLPMLTNDNAQGEYYLTDIVKLAVNDGVEIATIEPEFAFEIEGVNDRIQLANLERAFQSHQVYQLQLAGVQFADPSRVDIRGTLTCDQDVFIDINTVFVGDVHLGEGVRIDAGNVINNSRIDNQTHIKAHCVIDDSMIGQHVAIGPFAHLRPKTVLADDVKIGNFVETKKTTVGVGSKINHLSYAGDSIIGQDVNVGAGVITCNYDGVNKFTTTIGDRAFIGSNSSLVAPVTIGSDATIGAGSVITKDAQENALTLARTKQATITGWSRPTKKTK
ncbi:bifunctional UDP-N-acetylglucosamine diphosphorylase/glucosamine-1-phosphate N-acetyltransferase GlmU, partial [Moraxella catarrhalis]